MTECEKLANCSFVSCCDAYERSTAAKGFVSMYCKGNRMNDCVRKKLSNTFGKDVVPKNMMPNGSPLPGTQTDDWDERALHFRRYLG
ncbi:MAG: hypothetical protein JXR88_08315 [Clostridia bacterium]|nr:hypothetical protein [Clostridia bacterium]